MAKLTEKRRKRLTFKKPGWHVSFKNPFGFPMDQTTQMIIKNTQVRAAAEPDSNHNWKPLVRRAGGKNLCCGTRYYFARTSALMAAHLFIKHVRTQKSRTEVVEYQLMLPFMSNSHAMAAA